MPQIGYWVHRFDDIEGWFYARPCCLEREESLDLTPQPWKGCALPLKLFPLWR